MNKKNTTLIILACVLIFGLFAFALNRDSGEEKSKKSEEVEVVQPEATVEPSTPSEPDTTIPPSLVEPSDVEVETADDLPDYVVEDVYLTYLRDMTDEWDSIPDEDVVELGRLMCVGWDEGMNFEETLDRFLTVGYDLEAAAVFMGATVGAFCPEHETLFDIEI